MQAGGIERALISMINNLKIDARDITVCINERGHFFEQLLKDGVRIITPQQIFDDEYEIAVGYATPRPYAKFSWAPYVKAKKKIQWFHGNIEPFKKMPVLIEGIDQYVCISNDTRDIFLQNFPHEASKTQVIYSIIDEDFIRVAADEPVADMPKKGGLNVVTVARLSPEKGVDRAIRVCQRLRGEGYDFYWYVIGNGDIEEELQTLISQSKLEGRVVLCGARINPYPYIKQADIFVLPSRFESFGLVVVEAEILARPILLTNICGVKEQIISGKNGSVVGNTEEAIYEGLKWLLEHPEARARYTRELQNYHVDNAPSLLALERLFELK